MAATKCRYTTYLAGPMQAVAHSGAGWRTKLGELLENLRICVQNPVKSESQKTGLNATKAKSRLKMLTALAIQGDKDAERRFRRMINQIVKADFICVHDSDFLIAMVVENVVSIGTTAEIIESANKRIPVYILYLGKIENFPHWMMHYVIRSRGKVFPIKRKNDFTSLLDFLRTKFALAKLENSTH